MKKTKKEIISDISYWTDKIEEDLNEIEEHTENFYKANELTVVRIEDLDSNQTYVDMYLLRNARMHLKIHQEFLRSSVRELEVYEEETTIWNKFMDIIMKR